MPFFGLPFPRRFGGHKPGLITILESLNANRGTAYDTTQPSNVYLENMAIARAVDDVWSGNARLANQWDPARMTDSFGRWETMLQTSPSQGDSQVTRRQRIAGKLKGLSGPTMQVTNDACAALLGSVFVQIEYTSLSAATAHWPATGEPDAWTSSLERILVRVRKPQYASTASFFQLMNTLLTMLDGMMPAWTAFDWAVTSDSTNGFLLDDTVNLDFESFDS